MAEVFGLALHPDDRREAMYEVIAYGALLMPLILGHGMISGDLRSGAAMLWLQKPVHPVLYFQARVLEVTGLALLLVLAVLGAGASITAWSVGAEAARELLAGVPTVLLVTACLCVVLFGFSGWGARTDSLFVVVFFVASVVSMAAGSWIAGWIGWIAPPVDAFSVVGDSLAGHAQEEVGKSALLIARFILLWAAIGTVGLLVSTRSPLPKESSR
jgi:hypothetical protein